MNINELDIREISGVKCCIGRVMPFGATIIGDSCINFSINSAYAESCELVLYHQGENKPFAQIIIPDEFRVGDNYSIMVFGQNPEELEYTYRFTGEYDPQKGLCFDAKNELLDPYAKLITGREVWRQRHAPMRCKPAYEDFAWEGDISR